LLISVQNLLLKLQADTRQNYSNGDLGHHNNAEKFGSMFRAGLK